MENDNDYRPLNPDDLNLSNLDETDKNILRLKYANKNLSYAEIGKLLDPPINRQAVHQRVNKEKVKVIWKAIDRDLIYLLTSIQYEAYTVMVRMLRSDDDQLAYKAAKDLLDPVLKNFQALLPKPIEDIELMFVDENEKEKEIPDENN